MFALYFDEDSADHELVAALRSAGFDCVTADDAQMRRQPDERHLAFAAEAGRVLFTRNTVDFRKLSTDWAHSGRQHAGIIVLTRIRTPVRVQFHALEAMAAQFDSDDVRGHVWFLLNYASP